MGLDEIAPHLYKIATLYLKNNKRKVGWIFIDQTLRMNQIPLTEIFFISVQKGKRYQKSIDRRDHTELQAYSERISIELIDRIRSSM
jgi:hypothetical protein